MCVSLKFRRRYRSAFKNDIWKFCFLNKVYNILFCLFFDRFFYTWTRLSQTNGHQLKVSPQGKIEKHSFSCTSVNTFIFLADALFENEIKKLECDRTQLQHVDVKQAHIQLFDWPVVLMECDRLCCNYFAVEMKNACVTQTVNLVCHCSLPKYHWQHAYIVIFFFFLLFYHVYSF